MIADTAGVPDDSFGLDLSEGRALATVDEFSVGSPLLTRWRPMQAQTCTEGRTFNEAEQEAWSLIQLGYVKRSD
ncbi:hypothetical protein [Nocardia cyriacigeorgica]|uniref:hypothetical protein n=1 Tax=Nocardia cyriacigeorgica TaxID=135487 RepID=UPI00189530CD|nr:hypothetical protein [Nocardia cyriacigeorgica]MBF6412879.1 hypothetical protein [Nocardia cyriacigeorgica]